MEEPKMRNNHQSTSRIVACLTVAGAVFSVLAGPSYAVAQDSLPAAEVLLAKHVEAQGGADAFSELRSAVSKGTMELVGLGISGKLTLYQTRPASSLTVFEAQALGTIRSGTNGEIAWEYSDLQGPRLYEGAEKAFALREAVLDGSAKWRDLFSKYETVGIDTVGEKSCYRLVMTPKEGSPETWCLDVESKLLVKMDMKLDTAMGQIPVETTFSDYREVDGIKSPFRVSQKVMAQEMLIVLESVEYNPELDLNLFELPDEIKSLLDKRSESDTPAEAAAQAD
jgi:hypothetical protein